MRDRLPTWPYRFGLLAIAFAQLGVTLQALVAPKSFYEDFPLGRGWVEAYPAYNEHLIYDYGAYTLGALLALAIAGMWLDRRVVQLAIISWLAGASIHFVYHLVTIDRFGTGDAITNIAGLLLYIVLPGGLLVRSINESQQRIQGAPARGPLRKVAYGMARRRLGRVPEPFAVTAHHTKLFGAMSGFEMALERSKSVPARYKALGELRAAMVVGCEFCVDIGSMIARESGLTDDELKDLIDWQASERLDQKDKLVLAYADAISSTPVEVSDELFAQLHEHFDEEQLVELTAAIAWENWRARFNWAFGLGKEGYSEGAYCVPVINAS